MNILIVDDDESLSKTLSLILKRKGFDVMIANSGPEAIEIVRLKPFDLTFMDIKMPGMNGVEVYEQIRNLRPESSVIMITAYALEDLIEKALNLGALGILYKPVDIEKVLSIIEEVSRKPQNSTILVVDDDMGIAITLKNILMRQGYTVETSYTGIDAIRIAHEKSPEIAVIDIKLPDINGLQVSLALKKENPDISIIIITGYRQELEPLFEIALKEAAYTVLDKPLDIGSFLTIVKEISKKKIKGIIGV